jgi:histidine triad (HIT) family protein
VEAANCVFCAIAAGRLPATVEYEDAQSMAFRDAHPMAPVHVLVIPRRHIVSLATANEEEARVAADLVLVVKRVADRLGLAERGYRVVANAGSEAGQTVPHLHWHILAGRPLRWPPG